MKKHISVHRVLETLIIEGEPRKLVVREYYYGTRFTDDHQDYEVENVITNVMYTTEEDGDERITEDQLQEVDILGLHGQDLKNKIREPLIWDELDNNQLTEIKQIVYSVEYCRNLATEKCQEYLKGVEIDYVL